MRTFLLCTVLFFFGIQGFSQCNTGYRPCGEGGECIPSRECTPGVPPPPGLPIDFGISALIASGLLLGGYHLRKKKED
ncbi:hypothetical protein RM549_11285 [Salegentibacter sp. F188]|uniref:Uncharacterized protein n=1 Tax=Autumnicola patrickiae TaxID=3075591 RepID=A0ABU3E560_9FLAO|nr:hypothetical protein [Salegentibacter sp. F188]MDT0690372.1 hypothetical protein [Salegentibacter sp. F188]